MKIIKKTLILITAVGLIFALNCKKEDDPPPDPEPEKKVAWAVGLEDSTGYGLILFSDDAGETWERQAGQHPALLGADAVNLVTINENTAWVVGTNNAILKTTNAGADWIKVEVPGSNQDAALADISMAGEGNLWISGTPGVVYNSTDNGNTWTIFDTSIFSSNALQGIHCVNSDVIYTVGNNRANRGFISRTLDGGSTWDSIVPADNYNKHEWIGAVSSGTDNIVIFGGQSHYINSTDGGLSWNNDSVELTGGVGGADINDLIMLDAQTWWGAFDLEVICITHDGGANWTKQTSAGPGNFFLVSIDTYDGQMALIAGISAGMPRDGKIIKTTDGGDTWEMKHLVHSLLWKVAVAP